ncbi:hypothetical protein [Chitinophaga niabensis]|uniref:Zinc-finger n=1 Tax=Chitinophaga niabensis TaxID=536979 RepID=A0A1N6JJK7_9BACT|nr:hypothetical protein [Chitinophaga niabensis]SIO44216.1 hypothetical protein SAMN04488055_4062 [Chitinophaga niabensis]
MSTDINISNYEDYLYSYVDGELQAEEVLALENFLEKYPQFRAELDILLSTRLQPEAMVFDNKASLYRGREISLQNYQSHLLNYIDGELNQQEKDAFEQFVSRHPAVAQDLKVWQATKLQADTAVRFENKSVLYRKASHRTVIRPAYWWGAAAAVMAGAFFFLTLSDSTDTGVIAVNQTETEKAQPATVETITAAVPKETPKAAPQVATPETTPAKAPILAATNTTRVTAKTAKVAVNTAPAANTALAANTATNKTIDLTNVPTEQHDNNNAVIAADISKQLKQIPGNEVAVNRPSIEVGTSAPLATPAPAAAEPGELIMSVTGNGLESKVLDKVTNVARLFAKKRNK